MAKGRIGSVRLELLSKSREAALNAVQTYNNPLTTFKTESFIVQMVISWTYLLHAYFRREGIDYRYFDQKPQRRRFDRTKSGAYKYWELERCLNHAQCPLDPPTKSNLRFLIGLRDEIEHHLSTGIDDRFAGRYLACCLNYERAIVELFGTRHSLGRQLTFTLQFRDLMEIPDPTEASESLPSNVAKYVQDFETSLPEEEFQSPHFSYRLLFIRKLTNKRGQADRVIEFIGPESELAQNIDKEYWLQKEVERPKHLVKAIRKLMHDEGYPRFKTHDHTKLWQSRDGKNPAKGFGINIEGTWYWYDRWVDEVRKHCQENSAKYTSLPAQGGSP